MKIAHLEIRNFKAIEHLEIDFTDALGRVRPVTIIAGPNASGKTCILEALDASIGHAQRLHDIRVSLTALRRGASCASVSAELRFPPDEVAAAGGVASEQGPFGRVEDGGATALLNWTFPDPDGRDAEGRIDLQPADGLRLVQARAEAMGHVAASAAAHSRLDRSGRLYAIAQERAGLRVPFPRDVAALLLGSRQAAEARNRTTEDLKTILTMLAIRSLAAPAGAERSTDYFAQVAADFARLSPPHRLLRVEPTDDGYDIRFSDGSGEYGFDALSSGQRMLLRYIVPLRLEHIHRSIVAIDEVELHQHPAWQAGLVRALPGIGDDNQYILTTHSEHVAGLVPPEAVVRLGALSTLPALAEVAG